VARWKSPEPVPGPHQVYGFLTTAPNAIVEPIHPKALPVILMTGEERDVWIRAAPKNFFGSLETKTGFPNFFVATIRWCPGA
jgi:putative SOS response-associated peptidase YedK